MTKRFALLGVLALIGIVGCSKKEEVVPQTPANTSSAPAVPAANPAKGGANLQAAPSMETNPGAKEPAYGTKTK